MLRELTDAGRAPRIAANGSDSRRLLGWHRPAAAVAAFALRLFFVWTFPYSESGDTPVYEELARNWADRGTYGLMVDGHLVSGAPRSPGYPAFLAIVHRWFGEAAMPVMLVQVAIDVATCFVIARIAWSLAPETTRRRVALAALWLSALCPFTANYTAAVLTESLAVSLSAIVLALLVDDRGPRPFATGLVIGLATLVRPDSILLTAPAGLGLALRRGRPDRIAPLRASAVLAAGLSVALAPWMARNWVTLHEIEPFATRYAELPGEYAARGFYDWTFTWLWRPGDLERVPWKLDEEIITIDDVPGSAFDSSTERKRVAELLARYDRTTTLTPDVDRGFAEIAATRTARNPLRTFLTIPLLRSLAMWFTPRVELLPGSGKLLPVRAEWEGDAIGYCATVGFLLLGFAYTAMAAAGAYVVRRQPATTILVAFVILRTAFMAYVALTPEPRYVLECSPAILALAAGLWA